MKTFTYKELAIATNKFNISTKVGQGGYGNVYKGVLSYETFMAIKGAKMVPYKEQKSFRLRLCFYPGYIIEILSH